MWYLCVCQQPDNSKLFKGHGPASLGGGGGYELSYSEGVRLSGTERPEVGRGVKSVRIPCSKNL